MSHHRMHLLLLLDIDGGGFSPHQHPLRGIGKLHTSSIMEAAGPGLAVRYAMLAATCSCQIAAIPSRASTLKARFAHGVQADHARKLTG